MGKYLLKRILYSIFSIICIMTIMIIILFAVKDRNIVIASDPYLTKLTGNSKELYKIQLLEKYEYVEAVRYNDYVNATYRDTLKPSELKEAKTIPYVTKSEADKDSSLVSGDVKSVIDRNEYLVKFVEEYTKKGYNIVYLNASFDRKGYIKENFEPNVVATYDKPIFSRLWSYFSGMIKIESTNDVFKQTKQEGNYFTSGYYFASSITEWEDFTNYWGGLETLLSDTTKANDYDNNRLVYSKEIEISSDTVSASENGEFKWNVYKYDETTGEKVKLLSEDLTITEGGIYNFELIRSINDGGSFSYTGSSNKVRAETGKSLIRGSEYPVAEKKISVIWDEYSNMPALVGSGTTHKYLVYFDDQFPYIHQNIITLNLGTSITGETKDREVLELMFGKQGKVITKLQEYPTKIGTGEYLETSDDFHTVRFSTVKESIINKETYALYGSRYYLASAHYNKISRAGYSFTIGIISTVIAYFVGIPLGVLMAKKKDKIADKIGMGYIIFMIAVPSLAYIFLFSSIGQKMGLPLKFAEEVSPAWLVYVLPVASIALPSIAGEMKWIRRYMIDQSNSDYVKFARSQGLSEGEIFRKHIMKNALIPIVHGIPGSIIGCLSGAFITEKVYGVPGTGSLLMSAINNTDNPLILGLTFFYSILSIISLILGDILLTIIDPRISFTGGRK